MDALLRLFWSVRAVSKLAFVGGAMLAGWLVLCCSDDDTRSRVATTKAAAPAQPSYEPFHAALEESRTQTLACISTVRAAFDRPLLAGPVPGKPPPNRAPVDRGVLKDGIVFEVPIDPEGEIANCAPEGTLPIHDLQDPSVYPHIDRDSICGIDHPMKLLALWPDRAAEGISKLRAPKRVPPVVLYYWRWCDHDLGYEGPFTCSVGVVWMQLPSKQIVAMASGAGTAKPVKNRGRDDIDRAPYVVAMHRAEQQLVAVVRTWK